MSHSTRSLHFRPASLFLLVAGLICLGAPAVAQPEADPEPAADLGTPYERLRVVVRTDASAESRSDDSFELCIAPNECWPLDNAALPEGRPGGIDEIDLDVGPRLLEKIKGLTLRPSPGSGGDAWGPSCLSVLADGELLYCNDRLSASIGTNEGDLPFWTDTQVDFRGCGGCYRSILTHGPMVGHTTRSTAKIWFRTASRQWVQVRYGLDASLADAETSAPFATELDSDFTGIIELEGLEPDSRYFYEVLVDGFVASEPLLSFRTAPSSGATFEVVVGSCSGFRGLPTYFSMLENEPEMVIFLGDYHYADSTDPARLDFFYRNNRDMPGQRALLSRTPTWAIWDDHDYAGNDQDGRALGKDRALAAFERYWANGGYGTDGVEGIWSSIVWGDVEFFLLDGRYHRNRPQGEMLGSAQLDWLLDGLSASTATFKVLVSGSAWNLEGGPDSWAVHLEERDRIFDHVMERGIEGVMLLSGDVHRAEIRRINEVTASSYPLWEFVSSPLASVTTPCPGEPPAPEIVPFCVGGTHSFGLMRFDTTSTPPSMTYEIRDSEDRLLYSMAVTLDELRLPE